MPPFPAPPQITDTRFGTVLDTWQQLAPLARLQVARDAGLSLGRYLNAGGRVESLDLENSRVEADGRLSLLPFAPGNARRDPLRSRVVEGQLDRLRRRIPFDPGPDVRVRFLHSLHEGLGLDLSDRSVWTRHALAALEHETQLDNAARYRLELRSPLEQCEENLRGCWLGDPGRSLSTLLALFRTGSPAGPGALHAGRRGCVWVVQVGDLLVTVKHYRRRAPRLRDRVRPSRARRAWAGARVLCAAGLPTPEPLGYIEVLEGGVPVEGFYVTRALPPDVQTLRSFVKPRLHRQPPALRALWRTRMRALMLSLYRNGLVHGDCKASNLLVRTPGELRPALWWIDVEDLRVTGRPSLWRVIRNLVQLNGSVGRGIAREERFAFLRGFYPRFPLLACRSVHRYIERRTRVRLQRELKRTRSF